MKYLTLAVAVLFLLSLATPVHAAAGAIWTRDDNCGPPQNVNHYSVGQTVYISGDKFKPNTLYSWSISGKPGGASADPDMIVASGTYFTGGSRSFCFPAYVVQPDDDGEYGALFADVKSDNYRVTGITAEKTADPHLAREYEWTVDKSVSDEQVDLFPGDSEAVTYTIEVTKTYDPENDVHSVTGVIEFANLHPFKSAKKLTVTDCIQYQDGGTWHDIACTTIASSVTVANLSKKSFPYEFVFEPEADADAYRNAVYLSIDGTNWTAPGFVLAVAPFELLTEPDMVLNDDALLEDTYEGAGGPWPLEDSDTIHYMRTFMCNEDEGEHPNTATLTFDTGSLYDDANVDVDCHQLEVTKDAHTSLTREWEWSIDKSADESELLLAIDETFIVNYEVTVDATPHDSEWAVAGTINVHNPSPDPVTLVSVEDVVSPSIPANVDCGVSFPYELAGGDTLECSYTADLPGAEDRVNTATATIQNYAFADGLEPLELFETQFTGTADVSFAEAQLEEIDESADVTDTYTGPLGTVNGADAPTTFEYSREIRLSECGEDQLVENTASLETVDTHTQLDDDWTVHVDVPCPDVGCTLTQGYWKTHSEYGPAPYDDNWAQLPQGADTPFFLSGQSWLEMFRTPPKGGNAYYQMGHQYAAAYLNVLNGADDSVIAADLVAAEALLNTYTPDQIGALKGKSANDVKKQFQTLASKFGSYNEGLIGPGHCDEDATCNVA